jgi:excinuclease ABC subunit C
VQPRTTEFSPDRDREIFEQIPASAAVFALRSADLQTEPYVSRSANLRRRLVRLLGAADEGSRRLNLRDRVHRIDYWPVAGDFESQFVLYKALKQAFPRNYRDRLRLRPAPLVRLNLDNPYPRAYVTTRLSSRAHNSIYYGPFASRVAAEAFLNDSLDFFKLRRCVDDLNPDPAFPGCIYSEMKMCLAPCFRGCSDQDYADEVRRVQRYFNSGGESLRREVEAERDHASAELHFETAAALHARIAKIQAAAGQMPEIARPLAQLNGLMVQASTEAGCVSFYRVEGGRICDPLAFRVAASAEQYTDAAERQKHHSMEARIAEALDSAPAAPHLSAAELMEHLALLRRWYFRSQRSGELFLTESAGERKTELPMRRVVRGVSRVYAASQRPTADLAPAAHSVIRPS